MIYVESPEVEWSADGSPQVFMAGGITGCPDWQSEVRRKLVDDRLTLFNPRRADFPIHDPGAAKAQIEWEHRMLHRADAILFWFPNETLCPIVLYELGAWSMTHKPIAVGADSAYKRRQDVEIQTALARPDVRIADSLDGLIADVRRMVSDVNTWLRRS